jgi:hypothetical protein
MQQSSQPMDVEVAPERRAVNVGGPGDLALAAAIFAVAILPIVGVLAGFGRWGAGALGLGAAGAVFAGRELWAWVAAAIRGS